MFRRPVSIKEVAYIFDVPSDLRELSDENLNRYLENWEHIDVNVLACICSEILRRQIVRPQ